MEIGVPEPEKPEFDIRKGMPSTELGKEEFSRRLRQRFADPAFDSIQQDVDRIIEVAWDGYDQNRKAPRTTKAGRDTPIRTTNCPTSGGRPAVGSPRPRSDSRMRGLPRGSC